MKIYDCFTFFNEFDVLDIRFNELASVVDYFVLVEATKTFRGDQKPLYFAENKDRYAAFSDRIIHIIVNDMPVPVKDNRWPLEKYQRQAIAKGLTKCALNDVILISDADEIPSAEVVKDICLKISKNSIIFDLKENISSFLISLHNIFKVSLIQRVMKKVIKLILPKYRIIKCLHKHYEYFLNGYVNDHVEGTTIIRFSALQRLFNSDTDAARWLRNIPYIPISNGWHFSYLGSAETIAQKIHSFSHNEYDKPQYTNLQHIETMIEQGDNIFGKTGTAHKIKYVEINKSWPAYILKESARFVHLIKHIK